MEEQLLEMARVGGMKNARAGTVQALIRQALASEVSLSVLISSGAQPPERSTGE